MMTLRDYVTKQGTQEKAARKLGVAFSTLNRWLSGRHRPVGIVRQYLEELGIKI